MLGLPSAECYMSASCCSARASQPRVLPFEGGCNFRDIGGYSTTHGHTVRWGHVFRAGVLSYFKSSDHPQLHRLKVRAICDLRRAEERAKEPTHWPDDATQSLTFEDGTDMPTIRAFAAPRPQTAEGMFAAMIDLYRALPGWMSGRIRGMFECLSHGRVPMLVHCAAGKDRTGIAIGFLLADLGVDRTTIIEDYLLTNQSDFETFIRNQHEAQLGLADRNHPLLAMPAEMRKVLLSAQPEFLRASFDAVEQVGGLDAFLRDVCLIPDVVREKARENLLV
jgi:protein-tyrosine phosphatase